MMCPSVDVNDLTNRMTMTVKVTGITKLHVKLWFAKCLIKLAASIIGCGIKIEETEIE